MDNTFNIIDFNLPLANNFSLAFEQQSLPITNSPERLENSIICFCINGNAEVEVDFVRYRLEKGVILTAFPLQIIEEKSSSPDFSIIYITCSPEMLTNVLFRFPPEFILFLKENPVFKATEEIYKADMDFLDRLKDKYNDTQNVFQSSIIIHMIRIHYLEMLNLIQKKLNTEITQHSRKIEIMKHFTRLLLDHHLENREVQFYAEKISITPKYLSIITQENNGISAKRYIDNFIITEIKLYLKSSSKSIQEIAETFHFPDPSFFTKYFKHHTGQTPKEYRGN